MPGRIAAAAWLAALVGAANVHEVRDLAELELAKVSFVKLDPSDGCCQTELDDLWAMFAAHVTQKVWRVNCERRPGACESVLADSGRKHETPNQPLFGAWVDGQYEIYSGSKELPALVAWLQKRAGNPPPPAFPPTHKRVPGSFQSTNAARVSPPGSFEEFSKKSEEERHAQMGDALDSGKVDLRQQQGSVMAALVGRYYVHTYRYAKARHFYNMAAIQPDGAMDAIDAPGVDDCGAIQLATFADPYPASLDARDAQFAELARRADALVARARPLAVPFATGAAPFRDAYSLCVQTAFYHSFYYTPDMAERMARHFAVATRAFPELLYTAPHLVSSCAGGKARCKASAAAKRRQLAAKRGGERPRLRLGIGSAFFTPASSVLSDFRGVLERLPRDRFEVFWLNFDENGDDMEAKVVEELANARGRDEVVHHIKGSHNSGAADNDPYTYPTWLHAAHKLVGGLHLDVLLYLDLTMSPLITRVACARLARVQLTSHGHPTTSGIPSTIMDYYASWAAAEDFENGADPRAHYTEELALLPAHLLHQYYEPRVTDDGRSALDGQRFRHITRADFAGVGLPDDVRALRWYVCMQKPFKLAPEFDGLLAGVQRDDPSALLVMHKAPRAEAQEALQARLKRAGVELARVRFLDALQHYQLLGLYANADVVLDSYPASGCTTTREALELGALIVTLPARYLGSRWTLAYYELMGVRDLVARDAAHYVELAVRCGTDAAFAERTKARILETVGRLFRRDEAVDAWADLLERLADGDGAAGGGPGAADDEPVFGSAAFELDDEPTAGGAHVRTYTMLPRTEL